jgi:hypothetical protein
MLWGEIYLFYRHCVTNAYMLISCLNPHEVAQLSLHMLRKFLHVLYENISAEEDRIMK